MCHKRGATLCVPTYNLQALNLIRVYEPLVATFQHCLKDSEELQNLKKPQRSGTTFVLYARSNGSRGTI